MNESPTSNSASKSSNGWSIETLQDVVRNSVELLTPIVKPMVLSLLPLLAARLAAFLERKTQRAAEATVETPLAPASVVASVAPPLPDLSKANIPDARLS